MYWIAVCDKDKLTRGLETGMIGLPADAPAVQQVEQGSFLIAYCPATAPDGDPLETFSALGRVADSPGDESEDAGFLSRKIAYFAAFDVPFTNVEMDLLYPAQQPGWTKSALFPIEAPDFLTIAEAMLPPPIFQKVQSVAEDRLL